MSDLKHIPEHLRHKVLDAQKLALINWQFGGLDFGKLIHTRTIEQIRKELDDKLWMIWGEVQAKGLIRIDRFLDPEWLCTEMQTNCGATVDFDRANLFTIDSKHTIRIAEDPKRRLTPAQSRELGEKLRSCKGWNAECGNPTEGSELCPDCTAARLDAQSPRQ